MPIGQVLCGWLSYSVRDENNGNIEKREIQFLSISFQCLLFHISDSAEVETGSCSHLACTHFFFYSGSTVPCTILLTCTNQISSDDVTDRKASEEMTCVCYTN